VEPVKPTEPSLGAYNDTLTGDFVGTGQFAGGAVLAVTNDIATPDGQPPARPGCLLTLTPSAPSI
jgi:hypothetical protein